MTAAKPAKRAARKATPVSMRFFLSEELGARLEDSLARVEASRDAAEHHAEFAHTLLDLVAEGLDYYFLRTAKAARVGFLLEQSVVLAQAGVMKVIGPVVRRTMARLTHEQLVSVAASVRALMK